MVLGQVAEATFLARARIHARAAARALRQGCRAASLLPGFPPVPMPGRNSLSPVGHVQLPASTSDFWADMPCGSLPLFVLFDNSSEVQKGQAGGKTDIDTNPVGTLALHLKYCFPGLGSNSLVITQVLEQKNTMENQILCHHVMGINEMKSKSDVSNEDSHIPLHFLLIKHAATFTPLGGGNGVVYTGGGSDAVGTMFLLPLRFSGSPGGTVPQGGPHSL